MEISGYQLRCKFSIIRMTSLDFRYSWTSVILNSFLILLTKMHTSVCEWFSLKYLWKGGGIPLMGLKFKGCSQKPVTFVGLFLGCHTKHTCVSKHSQISTTNTIFWASKCTRLNIVHFYYLCMHRFVLLIQNTQHFNNIWPSYKIF